MYKKHFNIPVFIPELACPFQCIYCDQSKISGVEKLPDDQEIVNKIESHLLTIPRGSEVQLAYFGGNFTGISLEQQEHFLKLITPYISEGRISGIRLSTRPDYINDEVLSLLKRHHVRSIELGAQSFDDEVLRKSRRGHTAEVTAAASQRIREYGFSLGLQMMIGLPGDKLEKALNTAHRIVELGADDTRIYPTLVIKGTVLETMFMKKVFTPLKLEEAISWCAEIIPVFEAAGTNILKVGLHPSEGLLSGDDLVAGPFHPSFRELVETRIWRALLEPLTQRSAKSVEISVPPGQINYAVGYGGTNKKMLETKYLNVKFKTSDQLSKRLFSIRLSE